MAIEYANKSQSAGDEGASEAPGPEEQPEDQQEATASLPMSILAGKSVSPGDVVRLEVVSVDDQAGTVTVKYAEEPPAPEKRGISGMSAAFD